MPTLLAQIAPQRSTQYSALARALGPREFELSALAPVITSISDTTLGGQLYVNAELTRELTAVERAEMGGFACTNAFFEIVPVEGVSGPLLRPIDTGAVNAWPDELVQARRYRGKTNELFTRFLCNIARHSSAYANEPWSALRVLDPLAGGGTTLFTALTLGASAYGVEKTGDDVTSTATFMRQFCNESEVRFTEKEERLKSVGRRYQFSFGAQQLVLACGNTADTPRLLNAYKKVHLIVTDLPYGIQHKGPLSDLLYNGLPAWLERLEPGGAIAFSWDATRYSRDQMLAALEEIGGVTVCAAAPYSALGHAVDRVIKRRDVIVANTR